jgi:hypothetical protein
MQPGPSGSDAISDAIQQLEASVGRVLDELHQQSDAPDARSAGKIVSLEREAALWRSGQFDVPGNDSSPFKDASDPLADAVAILNSERVSPPTVSSADPATAREAHQQLYDALVEAQNLLQLAGRMLDKARRELR